MRKPTSLLDRAMLELGPTQLNIPRDFFYGDIECEIGRPIAIERGAGGENSLNAAAELLAASRSALDPAWRMPLDEEYDEGLKSNFADMANIAGRAGGAITAAMFLKRYATKYPWAHLDVAGTAWKSGAAKGATGRPVALLTHFVLARAA